MKIKSCVLLTIIIMLSVFPCGCAAKSSNTAVLQIGNKVIYINGNKSELDVAPIIQDGRTLLPLRAVVEGLGGSVAWDEETNTAVLAKGEKAIFITIGSKTAFVNTAKHTLDTEPIIIDGRTMLPIRFVAENLGFTVTWNESTSEIIITGE